MLGADQEAFPADEWGDVAPVPEKDVDDCASHSNYMVYGVHSNYIPTSEERMKPSLLILVERCSSCS